MSMKRAFQHPALPALLLFLLAAGLALRNIIGLLPEGAAFSTILFPDHTQTAEMLLHYTILPRITVGLMAGAGLGLAGAILQIILRNPLAEPATLGISAGAHLMMALAMVLVPASLAGGREWAAFAGAGLALTAIIALSSRKGLSPVTVTLSGMIVSLYCGAASAVLTPFNHDFLISLFLWGAGYLDQQDWSGAIFLAPRLAVLALIALMLVRPLTLLGLDDAVSRSLGLPLIAYRMLALVTAAALTAVVTTSVGIISFVGLASPALAAATGARRIGARLMWSAVMGALLLSATDQIVLSLPVTYRLFPSGAVTALLGAPMLFLLIGRLKLVVKPGALSGAASRRLRNPWMVIGFLVLFIALAAQIALLLGNSSDGWRFDGMGALFAWRWPRALAAFSGGAMLALTGAVLQRMTGNPLASPEVLGVSSSAMLGIILLLLTASAPTRGDQVLAGAAGACLALILMLALSRRPGFAGERLLLIGIALSSVSGFVMAVLMTAQDPRLSQLLAWLSGSTYAVRPEEAGFAALMLLLAMALIPVIRRWLELLALGGDVAAAAGVPIMRSRIVLYTLCALLTAGSTILIGPLSFAGLMGPHLARLTGFQRAGTQMLASALIGGLVLLLADWVGRNVIFPFQIPAGLLATLVGGPFLLFLIGRRA